MKFSKRTEAEILAIAVPIMDNLMEASTAIDYDRHIRHFTDRLKNILSREHFQWICREYQSEKGFFTDREFVTLFRRPDSIAIIWKQHFTQAAGDFVAEMVLVQHGEQYLVDHVMVF